MVCYTEDGFSCSIVALMTWHMATSFIVVSLPKRIVRVLLELTVPNYTKSIFRATIVRCNTPLKDNLSPPLPFGTSFELIACFLFVCP